MGRIVQSLHDASDSNDAISNTICDKLAALFSIRFLVNLWPDFLGCQVRQMSAAARARNQFFSSVAIRNQHINPTAIERAANGGQLSFSARNADRSRRLPELLQTNADDAVVM